MKAIYLDIETTGFSRQWDYIIEIAAVIYDENQNKIVDKFHEYIKPGKTIPPVITELTGITNQQVRFAKSEREVLGDFMEWLFVKKIPIVVGHNYKSFDGSFLKAKAAFYGLTMYPFLEEIDTLPLARRLLPKGGAIENHKQETLAEFFKIEYQAHSAIEDVKALIKIHEKLKEKEKPKRADLGF